MIRRTLPFLIAALVALTLAAPAAWAQSGFNGWYNINDAAANNNIDQVRAMLLNGEHVNNVDGHGRTPLIYAAMNGSIAMTKLLLDNGASVDFRDGFGNTPLHWAAGGGNLELVKTLLAAKAPLETQNKQGLTPLMLAASNNRLAVVKLLLKDGADPRKRDFTGRDALGWARLPAVRQAISDAAKKG
jgi:ankyrin repeat protein